jgi:ATP-dependent RNA helicase DeaD
MQQTQQTEEKPAPKTFDALSLSADIRKAIDTLGYKHPTPVQLAVFEPASRGKSLVVQARTGTGKTCAFGLPIVDTLVKKSVEHCQALILVPTRELALQVGRELIRLSEFRGTKVMSIYGGAPMGKQVEELAAGAQVVVGTPGRVLDHLRRGTMDPSHVRIFVLDEADEMLSMGFAKELHAIVEFLPKERQGLYFSATIPGDITRLASSQLKDPEYITLSSDSVGALSIQHFIYLTRGGGVDKRADIVKVLEVEDPESAILFCNTKDETEKLAEYLKVRGYDADWLNGDLEQRERERIMQATRDGKLRFLVATDVAARGIDVSHLTHVFNADFPENAEAYVHRTGRTGRAGRTGTAISIVGPKDVGNLYLLRLTYKIRPIEKQLPSKGELATRAETDIVQFFADAFGQRKAEPADLSLARRLLTHPDAETIVAGLLRDHLGAREAQGSNVQDEASESRRAKNPAPIHAVVTEGTPPHTLREGIAPALGAARPERADRGPRGPRPERHERQDRPEPAREQARAEPTINVATPAASPEQRAATRPEGRGAERRPRRGGMPQAELANWEPRAEADDDRPILEGGGTSRRSRAHDIPLPGITVEGEDATVAFKGNDIAAALGNDLPAETLAQVYVGVGRRDGIHPADIEQLFADSAQIGKASILAVRVRDRATFVSLRKEDVENAVTRLHGISYRGKNLVVERAREHAPRS